MANANEIFRILTRLETQVDKAVDEISTINVHLAKLPCQVHETKISTLQKIVYGAVGVVLLAFMASLMNPMSKADELETKKAKTKQELKVTNPFTYVEHIIMDNE